MRLVKTNYLLFIILLFLPLVTASQIQVADVSNITYLDCNWSGIHYVNISEPTQINYSATGDNNGRGHTISVWYNIPIIDVIKPSDTLFHKGLTDTGTPFAGSSYEIYIGSIRDLVYVGRSTEGEVGFSATTTTTTNKTQDGNWHNVIFSTQFNSSDNKTYYARHVDGVSAGGSSALTNFSISDGSSLVGLCNDVGRVLTKYSYNASIGRVTIFNYTTPNIYRLSDLGRKEFSETPLLNNNNKTIMELYYHNIRTSLDDGYSSINSTNFMRQIQVFYDAGWETCTYEQVADWYNGVSEDLPNKCLMISFDDASCGVLWVGKNILDSFGYTGNIPVIANSTNHSSGCTGETGTMGWDDLRTLMSAGYGIGSHSFSHIHMVSDNPDATEKELQYNESKRLIEQNLGITIKLFTFPYNDRNDSTTADCYDYYDVCMGTSHTIGNLSTPVFSYRSSNWTGKGIQRNAVVWVGWTVNYDTLSSIFPSVHMNYTKVLDYDFQNNGSNSFTDKSGFLDTNKQLVNVSLRSVQGYVKTYTNSRDNLPYLDKYDNMTNLNVTYETTTGTLTINSSIGNLTVRNVADIRRINNIGSVVNLTLEGLNSPYDDVVNFSTNTFLYHGVNNASLVLLQGYSLLIGDYWLVPKASSVDGIITQNYTESSGLRSFNVSCNNSEVVELIRLNQLAGSSGYYEVVIDGIHHSYNNVDGGEISSCNNTFYFLNYDGIILMNGNCPAGLGALVIAVQVFLILAVLGGIVLAFYSDNMIALITSFIVAVLFLLNLNIVTPLIRGILC